MPVGAELSLDISLTPDKEVKFCISAPSCWKKALLNGGVCKYVGT